MGNRVHIFDISNAVYIGHCGMKQERYGAPVGGIQYLLNRLAVAVVAHDQVALCFDSPSFRSKHSEYKSGRVFNAEVSWQISELQSALSSCRFSINKLDGYEADDLIEWASKKAWAEFGDYFQTTIYSGDMDVAHSLRGGMRQCVMRSDGRDVTRENYSRVVCKGSYVPYNTISAYKSLFGCKSDSIPRLDISSVDAKEFYEYFSSYVNNIADPEIRLMPELFIKFAEKFGMSEEDIAKLEERTKIIYPAEKPEDYEISFNDAGVINVDMFAYVCALFGAIDALRCLEGPKPRPAESDVQRLRDAAKRLHSGEYAADHNIPVTTPVMSKAFSLDTFERGLIDE